MRCSVLTNLRKISSRHTCEVPVINFRGKRKDKVKSEAIAHMIQKMNLNLNNSAAAAGGGIFCNTPQRQASMALRAISLLCTCSVLCSPPSSRTVAPHCIRCWTTSTCHEHQQAHTHTDTHPSTHGLGLAFFSHPSCSYTTRPGGGVVKWAKSQTLPLRTHPETLKFFLQ